MEFRENIIGVRRKVFPVYFGAFSRQPFVNSQQIDDFFVSRTFRRFRNNGETGKIASRFSLDREKKATFSQNECVFIKSTMSIKIHLKTWIEAKLIISRAGKFAWWIYFFNSGFFQTASRLVTGTYFFCNFRIPFVLFLFFCIRACWLFRIGLGTL